MKFLTRILALILIILPTLIYSKNLTVQASDFYYANKELSSDSSLVSQFMDYGPKKKKGNFGKRVKKRNQYNRNLKLKRYDNNRRGGINIKWPFAVKTNLIYDGALTPNLAIEVPIKKKFSIELSSTYNAWDMKDNVKWKNLMIIPEFRYWLKDNTSGQFFGAHIGWAKYNIGGITMPYFADANYYRYDGWAIGLGLAAGYKWQITNSLSTEVNIGVGVIYTKYDKYLAPKCGPFWGSFKNILIAPTKVGLSFIYMFQ
jgi:hypothetical protein